ncbi:hypothetical protein J7E38_09480 [Bacillus sp. ISL-35]|uniref:hypothetical protein n=1 Tax=Bacillus sp. ISL-35 TaxID=2819122 RepID=UPI001BE7AA82|nr:hypothetical protein [Bacillus sp. ISL-35]MBT2679233.1 hypothetical protein [Bacillus sp. ISL-35]MBT2703129.1 hypothetical protein [Chryseobacterium sp. ISL-80]
MKGNFFNLATKRGILSEGFNRADKSGKITASVAVTKSFNCSLHKEFKGDIFL